MILVVGLTPAWQRTLWFDRVEIGRVNRARRMTEATAGKGVNVGRIAHLLGAKARLLTVAGGHRGRLLRRALDEDGVDARVLTVAGETRICQTLITPKGITELVEEGQPLSKREVAKFLAMFAREIVRAKMLVLMGTVPRGCGEDFYARMAGQARRRGIPCLMDAQTKQLMNAVREKPFVVRLTGHELESAIGMSCGNDRDVVGAARHLIGMGATWVVVSSGPGRVFAISAKELWSAIPPRIQESNPIGSGDAMMTGIAVSVHRGQSIAEALRYGVACGTANAMTETPGFLHRADVDKLLRRMKATPRPVT